jgi:hypothetical protein
MTRIDLAATVPEGTVTATMIEDSISDAGIRLCTLHLRYPRFIHSELMTHRVFSRNARSSRAVPTAKLLQEDPYIPHFLKNQPGMQAMEDMEPLDQNAAWTIWHNLMSDTRRAVQKLHELGVHKQWANRPLEWFGFIDVLVTSTDWTNWETLRNHPDAMPEIQALARAINLAQLESQPVLRHFYETEVACWHLPYITPEERENLAFHSVQNLAKVSAARCARISYKPFDADKPNWEADLGLFEKLMGGQPLHASPSEHQATPDYRFDMTTRAGSFQLWSHADEHGNLYGWRQFRKMLPGENVRDDHYGA